jgi:hypothetical protein
MSAKSVHNANGNLSLPPISTTLQAPSQMQVHGNAVGSSIFALSDYNQRTNDEKHVHQVEQQKHQQQYAGQWQSNKMNHQNYSNHEPTSHQSHYHQHRQIYQQPSYNHYHQKSYTHPISRHHNHYYNENLKSESLNWWWDS